MLFHKNETPANIVKIYPQASDLFNEHEINFCCQGDQPLIDQCKKLQINVANILEELNERYKNWRQEGYVPKNWDEISLEQLIDQLIFKHHLYLRQELPTLNKFVTRVYSVHGAEYDHLEKLYTLYQQLEKAIKKHMDNVTNNLFPLVKEYVRQADEKTYGEIEETIQAIEDEHELQTDLLQNIRSVTNDFVAPPHACGTYRVTYDRLAELEAKAKQYIHIENNILFEKLQ